MPAMHAKIFNPLVTAELQMTTKGEKRKSALTPRMRPHDPEREFLLTLGTQATHILYPRPGPNMQAVLTQRTKNSLHHYEMKQIW